MTLGAAFIDRLHEELLTHVMELSLEGIDPMFPNGRIPVREFRTRLRRVCRRWNQLILDNPILWKDVELFLPYITTHSFIEDELRLLHFNLRNGKNVMRRLAITTHDHWHTTHPRSSTPLDPLILRALDVIRAENEWESISLHVCGAVTRSLFSPLPSSSSVSPWKKVRVITITENRRTAQSDPSPFIISAEDAPALRGVFADVKYGDLAGWFLPWAQLTQLSLSMFRNGIAGYLEILSQCTQIDKACLEPLRIPFFYLNFGVQTSGASSVTLPIRELHTTFPSFDGEAPSRMDRLITPQLTTLSLCFIGRPGNVALGDADEAIMAAERMLRRSRCPLSHLKLGVNDPGLRRDTVLGSMLSAAGSSIRSLTLCIHKLPISSFTDIAQPLMQLELLDLLVTGRITVEEREQDVEDFGRWAQAWTASFAQTVSTARLEKRKADGEYTFASLPEPDASYLVLHRVASSEIYGRGRYLGTADLGTGIQGLKEGGWCINVALVDFHLDWN